MNERHSREKDFEQQRFLLIMITPLQIHCEVEMSGLLMTTLQIHFKVEMSGLIFPQSCDVLVVQLKLVEYLRMRLLSLRVL